MTRKGGPPDRWLAYKNMGERIAGTPFIAFKVPLKESFFTRVRTCDWFTPGELVDRNPDMKLIIDLTNTHRYYTPQSVESKGVNYYKLACPGQVVPAERLVHQFCDIVHEFLSGCANGQDTLIGVHCTHGVNRTGFLICSFMIRHLLINPREAISAFEEARGHHIERAEYVQALMKQYSKSGSGRKQKTPPRDPFPSAAVQVDSDGHRIQRYGFGTLSIDAPTSTTGSWTITSGPVTNLRKTDGFSEQQPSHAAALVSEPGPSRKRGPNEPITPSPPSGHRKGKKDKRTNKKQTHNTSGTQGEDVCNDSGHAAQGPTNSQKGAYLRRSLNANDEQREYPAYGCPPWKNAYQRTSSHLAPPQHQPKPRLPPSQFPSSHTSMAERGFGHRVEMERNPAAPWGGGGGGRGGGAWGRGRGRGGDSGNSWRPCRSRGWAGGRRQGEQLDQNAWGPHWSKRRHPSAHRHE